MRTGIKQSGPAVGMTLGNMRTNGVRMLFVYSSSVIYFVALFATFAYAQTPALLLFGGDDHKTFLGCLNCIKTDTGSICNKYGESGSEYSATSIWNRYGDFGSKYSTHSPWNKYSSSAPIIVDNSGQSYGYLSTNKYHPDRTRISVLNQLVDFVGDNDDLDQARDLYCGD